VVGEATASAPQELRQALEIPTLLLSDVYHIYIVSVSICILKTIGQKKSVSSAIAGTGNGIMTGYHRLASTGYYNFNFS
jgi:hypothetical protein